MEHTPMEGNLFNSKRTREMEYKEDEVEPELVAIVTNMGRNALFHSIIAVDGK